MTSRLKALHEIKQTRKGLLIVGVIELLLAYFSASWAIDSGNLWVYLLTLILIVGSVQNILKLITITIRNK